MYHIGSFGIKSNHLTEWSMIFWAENIQIILVNQDLHILSDTKDVADVAWMGMFTSLLSKNHIFFKDVVKQTWRSNSFDKYRAFIQSVQNQGWIWSRMNLKNPEIQIPLWLCEVSSIISDNPLIPLLLAISLYCLGDSWSAIPERRLGRTKNCKKN